MKAIADSYGFGLRRFATRVEDVRPRIVTSTEELDGLPDSLSAKRL